MLPDALSDANDNQEDNCHANEWEHPENLLSASAIRHGLVTINAQSTESGRTLARDAGTLTVDTGQLKIIFDHFLGALIETLGLEEVSECGGLVALEAGRGAILWTLGTWILTEEVDCDVRLDLVHIIKIIGHRFDAKRASYDVLSRITEILDQDNHLARVGLRKFQSVGEG